MYCLGGPDRGVRSLSRETGWAQEAIPEHVPKSTGQLPFARRPWESRQVGLQEALPGVGSRLLQMLERFTWTHAHLLLLIMPEGH